MTVYETIKSYCLREPKARERRNRSRAICNLLTEKYRLTDDKQKLIEAFEDYESYSRLFRMVQMENPETRGQDYEDGKELAQKKQIDLGYESGYQQDLKLSKRI